MCSGVHWSLGISVPNLRICKHMTTRTPAHLRNHVGARSECANGTEVRIQWHAQMVHPHVPMFFLLQSPSSRARDPALKALRGRTSWDGAPHPLTFAQCMHLHMWLASEYHSIPVTFGRRLVAYALDIA